MNVKIREARLETVAGITSKMPHNEKTEFAFAGKSNVGKSSLINALLQRKSLARTSATPGKTQTVNFYAVEWIPENGEAEAFYLVDLPGYGYTKASPDSRISWGKMVERYLKNTDTLQKIFLLVDIRHKPGENDIQMYDWIRYQGYLPVVIATKLDKLKKNEIRKCLKEIRQGLSMEDEDLLIPVSSETKEGIDEICALISSGNAGKAIDK